MSNYCKGINKPTIGDREKQKNECDDVVRFVH
jgi:hypothetical protein